MPKRPPPIESGLALKLDIATLVSQGVLGVESFPIELGSRAWFVCLECDGFTNHQLGGQLSLWVPLIEQPSFGPPVPLIGRIGPKAFFAAHLFACTDQSFSALEKEIIASAEVASRNREGFAEGRIIFEDSNILDAASASLNTRLELEFGDTLDGEDEEVFDDSLSPRSAEVWIADLGTSAKIRPVLILDWDGIGKRFLFAPITSQERPDGSQVR